MSLKAYDGMMCRKSIKYIQDEIIKRLDRLKEASENQLAETYANIFIEHFDNNFNVVRHIEYDTINEISLKEKIKEIETNDITIFTYIYKSAQILSKSSYVNPFTVHLNISLQAVNNKKILIYPRILVNEHKTILLEFLEDWYCQNQCDPDERVPSRIWKQREKDWYDFDEVNGFKIKIEIFDPTDWNSIVRNFRGDNAIQKILKYIPSDEERLKKITKSLLIKNEKQICKEKGEYFNYSDFISKLSDEKIKDYIKNNNIILTKIDEDCIKNFKLTYNPIVEIRKEKIQEIAKNHDL